MLGYNLIAVFNAERNRWLMCRRKKDPYKGLSNLVGGKIEKGEQGIDAAYRELFEETGISKEKIRLVHLINFEYPMDQVRVEVYFGCLKEKTVVYGEENGLYWSGLDENFFDMKKYAGEGNIGHILQHIYFYLNTE